MTEGLMKSDISKVTRTTESVRHEADQYLNWKRSRIEFEGVKK